MQRAEALRAMLQRPVRPDAEHMWGLMEETLSGHEEEVCRLKREKMELSKLVSAAWSPQVVLHTAALPPELQQLSVCKEELPHEQQERGPGLGQEEPGPPHIKEEEEEFPVKTEHVEECAQWSQLHQRQTEEKREAEAVASTSTQQMETQADGEDWGVSEVASSSDPAAALQPAGAEQLFSSHSSETDTEDSDGGREETAEPQSGSQTLEPETRRRAVAQALPVGRAFRRSVQLFNELQVSREALSFSCKVCGKRFAGRAALMVHVAAHPTDCGLCGERHHSSDGLKLHVETHKTCGVCGKRFPYFSLLERHMQVHTGLKPFACSVCGKEFSLKGNLKQHEQRHSEPLVCSPCGQTFHSQSHFDRHARLHAGDEAFRCSVCGKRFKTKGNLTTHGRVHTGESPYRCPVCGRSFNVRGNLATHARLHTGEKPFRCAVCGKAFSDGSSLSRHRVVHTGEKPYSCSICGRSFSQQSSLNTHTLRCRPDGASGWSSGSGSVLPGSKE